MRTRLDLLRPPLMAMAAAVLAFGPVHGCSDDIAPTDMNESDAAPIGPDASDALTEAGSEGGPINDAGPFKDVATDAASTKDVAADAHAPRDALLDVDAQPARRPIWWWHPWGWQAVPSAKSYYLVTSSLMINDNPFDAGLEANKIWWLFWGSQETWWRFQDNLDSLVPRYNQGARHLATDIELFPPTDPKYTKQQAEMLCNTIKSLPGLRVQQSNAWSYWDSDALLVLQDCPGLDLGEMIYPTCLPLTKRDDIYRHIMDEGSHYTAKKPAIGLSVYANWSNTVAVSWDLMKIQIDAARDAGNSWGSPLHPIAIFWVTAPSKSPEPTFTIDDVNCYIVQGDPGGPSTCP
jgi:hypothetical protein